MLSGLAQTGLLSGHPGILNAPALNQLLIDCVPIGWMLAPDTTSGRPPIELVLDGSNPLKDGVKNCPDCAIAFQAICQPPSAASPMPDLFQRRCPWPTGICQIAYPYTRCEGVIRLLAYSDRRSNWF